MFFKVSLADLDGLEDPRSKMSLRILKRDGQVDRIFNWGLKNHKRDVNLFRILKRGRDQGSNPTVHMVFYCVKYKL